MKNFLTLLLGIFVASCLAGQTGSVRAGQTGSVKTGQTGNLTVPFDFRGEGRIRVSIEHGWERNGRVPVILFLGDLEISLSVDAETLSAAAGVETVINDLLAGGPNPQFIVYEQNPARTRMRPVSESVPVYLKIDRVKREAGFYIENYPLKLAPIRVTFKEVQPGGACEITFGGTCETGVYSHKKYIFDPVPGIIYAAPPQRTPANLAPAAANGAISALERTALIALYNGTNGENWFNNDGWKGNNNEVDGFSRIGSEGSWYGINVEFGHVTAIYLADNNLTGSIPAELGDLASLRRLYLRFNNLTGSIPPELGNLQNLISIHLDFNELSGNIPAEFGNLSSLDGLYLHYNQLEGNIPPELGGLSILTALHLRTNALTGAIPPELGNLSNLVDLYLYGNDLDGGIPGTLGNLSNLRSLKLHSNRLTAIRDGLDWGNLSKLEVLYIYDNKLEGNIPPGIGDLESLEQLDLNSNNLKGEIPSDIANIKSLDDNQSDFRWNALYTNDSSLKNFLDLKQKGGNWERTQTIAPKDVKADFINSTSIAVSWTPIAYTRDTGRYIVSYGSAERGSYTSYVTTKNKTTPHVDVTGLTPGTTYYFAVQTQTDTHGKNKNEIISEYSEEVSASTGITISGRVTTLVGERESGVAGVTMTFLDNDGTEKNTTTNANGRYEKTVNVGWSGTVTPSKSNYVFEPSVIPYDDVTSPFPGQDYTAAATSPVISGRITNEEGVGIEGVTLTFYFNNDGTMTETILTDTDGYYGHAVIGGWSGTVVPSKTGYEFNPVNRAYSDNVYDNKPGENYAAAAAFPVISGRVTTPAGVGVEGVTLNFSSGGEIKIVPTDADGCYSHAVAVGWSGTVTPLKEGYEFDPVFLPYDDPVTGDKPGQNYQATVIAPFVSGRITYSAYPGKGIEGVTLTFSNSGGKTVTGPYGYYSHVVNIGWSGTAAPTKSEYTFEPGFLSYPGVTSPHSDQDYTGMGDRVEISGRIITKTGEGLEGVELVVFPREKDDELTIAAGGHYTYKVNRGWTGKIIPSKEGYTFNPAETMYTTLSQDVSDGNFEARESLPAISGKVETEPGIGVEDVILIFSNNGGTAKTNESGQYTHLVPYGWTGNVTPAKDLYTFSPARRVYPLPVVDNRTFGDFKATMYSPLISGRVTTADGVGVGGVTLTFSNDGGTAATGTDGRYEKKVPYDWSGTVTPSKVGYTFSNPRSYEKVTSDRRAQDYTAAPVYPEISGRVKDALEAGIGGVTLTFSNGGGSTVTDSEGNYRHGVPYNWSGTAAPSKEIDNDLFLLFDPLQNSYRGVTSNVSEDDYTLSVTLRITASRKKIISMTTIKYYGEINFIGEPIIRDASVYTYIIYRKETGGPFTAIAEFSHRGAFPYQDKYIDKDKDYTYKVRALTAAGKGGESNEAKII